jgi:hypothetical protein
MTVFTKSGIKEPDVEVELGEDLTTAADSIGSR